MSINKTIGLILVLGLSLPLANGLMSFFPVLKGLGLGVLALSMILLLAVWYE